MNTKIQQMQTDEHDQRSADAEKKSAAIDPFTKHDRPQLQVGAALGRDFPKRQAHVARDSVRSAVERAPGPEQADHLRP